MQFLVTLVLINIVCIKYWSLGGRNIEQKVVHERVRCFKKKPIILIQFDRVRDHLPEGVKPSSSFSNVGVKLE